MLRRLLLTGALCGVPLFCVQAQPIPAYWNPPARYDHAAAHLRVYRVDWLTIRRLCGRAYACSWKGIGASCLTYMPPIGVRASYDRNLFVNAQGYRGILRHEAGHCNGWAAWHPK